MIRSLLDAGRIYRSSNGTRCMLTWQRVTRCRRRFAEAYAETAKTSATINTRAVGCLQDLCKQKALSVTGRLWFQHAVGNQRLVTQGLGNQPLATAWVPSCGKFETAPKIDEEE